jgi:hypothetical protein
MLLFLQKNWQPRQKCLNPWGFIQQHDITTEDVIYFANSFGVVCAVNHRVRLFEGKASFPLTTHLKPKHANVPAFPLLEPNALVAHLVLQINEPDNAISPVFLGILDLAFVLRQWGQFLDSGKLQQLLPSSENFISLVRVVRFLEEEFGESFPPWLSQETKRVQPLTLAGILVSHQPSAYPQPTALKSWLPKGTEIKRRLTSFLQKLFRYAT